MRCRIVISPCEGSTASRWEVKSGGEVVGFGQSENKDIALIDAKAYITEWKKDKPKETRIRVPKAKA